MTTFEDAMSLLNKSMAALARASYADMERVRYFYLGYSRLEEMMWARFNRCCHSGRRIKALPRPLTIRVGGPGTRIISPLTD